MAGFCYALFSRCLFSFLGQGNKAHLNNSKSSAKQQKIQRKIRPIQGTESKSWCRGLRKLWSKCEEALDSHVSRVSAESSAWPSRLLLSNTATRKGRLDEILEPHLISRYLSSYAWTPGAFVNLVNPCRLQELPLPVSSSSQRNEEKKVSSEQRLERQAGGGATMYLSTSSMRRRYIHGYHRPQQTRNCQSCQNSKIDGHGKHGNVWQRPNRIASAGTAQRLARLVGSTMLL